MNFWSNIARMAALGLALSGCATVDYLHTPAGQFKGTVFVMWVGEGNGSGDGNFLFVPDPRDPLIFTRADPQSLGGVIQPGLMYTDGGSIPKIAQVFNGFSPWGYAPGYMIQDWLFVGRPHRRQNFQNIGSNMQLAGTCPLMPRGGGGQWRERGSRVCRGLAHRDNRLLAGCHRWGLQTGNIRERDALHEIVERLACFSTRGTSLNGCQPLVVPCKERCGLRHIGKKCHDEDGREA